VPAGAGDAAVQHEPWIQPPVRIDYGTNVRVGPGAFVNYNCTILDTCAVTIGARALLGPNVSLFAGAHPEDPDLRAGTDGPEYGAPVDVGEDAWIGGNVVVLPGVRIGRGAVVGAGSVVTRDVPDYWVAVGNPARLLREVRREKKTPQADGGLLPVGVARADAASPASSTGDVRDLPFVEALRRRSAAAAEEAQAASAVPMSREASASAPAPLHDESTGGVSLAPDLAE
jgi:acetyltransferase-like isoleucine patch superfamily enzyme